MIAASHHIVRFKNLLNSWFFFLSLSIFLFLPTSSIPSKNMMKCLICRRGFNRWHRSHSQSRYEGAAGACTSMCDGHYLRDCHGEKCMVHGAWCMVHGAWWVEAPGMTTLAVLKKRPSEASRRISLATLWPFHLFLWQTILYRHSSFRAFPSTVRKDCSHTFIHMLWSSFTYLPEMVTGVWRLFCFWLWLLRISNPLLTQTISLWLRPVEITGNPKRFPSLPSVIWAISEWHFPRYAHNALHFSSEFSPEFPFRSCLSFGMFKNAI